MVMSVFLVGIGVLLYSGSIELCVEFVVAVLLLSRTASTRPVRFPG